MTGTSAMFSRYGSIPTEDTWQSRRLTDRCNEDAVFVETSLKLNGVDDGMVAYSRVVGLLLQWYYQQ